MSKRLAALAMMVFFAAASAETVSAATAAQRCAANKTRTVCRKANCKFRCYARAASTGTTADPFCLARCESRFASSMSRIESRGGCATTNDTPALEAKVDAFTTDAAIELTGSPTGALLTTTAARRCGANKLRATGRKECAKLRCHARAKLRGTTPDPVCLSRAEAQFTNFWNRTEARGGCATTGDRAAIEAKVDAFVADVSAEIVTTPGATTTTSPPTTTTSPPVTTTTSGATTSTIAGTTTTTAITLPGSTTTTIAPTCCPAAQIDTVTSAGTLTVDGLPSFPFPAGVQTRIEVGTADSNCAHPSVVPAGGFTVPVFCIPALGYSSKVESLGCEGGTGDGNGTVWDANSLCPDPEVIHVGDTSDGVCNPAGQPCNTSPGGAGANTLGDIDTTRGDGACDVPGVHTQLDLPVRSTTWLNGDFNGCPDPDGDIDGGDALITQFDFILSPTTDLASSTYVDKNMDGCKRAGTGPDGPVTATGSPGVGPCCVVGDATTVVANGVSFTGGGPLYDIIFSNNSPTTISACNAPGPAATCTLTTDPCAD